jgi:hypothetical protein
VQIADPLSDCRLFEHQRPFNLHCHRQAHPQINIFHHKFAYEFQNSPKTRIIGNVNNINGNNRCSSSSISSSSIILITTTTTTTAITTAITEINTTTAAATIVLPLFTRTTSTIATTLLFPLSLLLSIIINSCLFASYLIKQEANCEAT